MTMRAISVFAALFFFAGCSDSTGPLGQQQLQLQVRALPTSPAAAAPGVARAPGVEAVAVDAVFIVLGGLKLETAGLDETVDWIWEESVVIPLDLAGEPTLAFDASPPAGTYKELEISVDKLEIGHPDEQPLIDQWPALADASVLVSGTITRNGTPDSFDFTAPLDIDYESAFPAPWTITGDPSAVTVFSMSFDVGQWFIAPGGGWLDPNDEGERSPIEAAISASIEVVEED